MRFRPPSAGNPYQNRSLELRLLGVLFLAVAGFVAFTAIRKPRPNDAAAPVAESADDADPQLFRRPDESPLRGDQIRIVDSRPVDLPPVDDLGQPFDELGLDEPSGTGVVPAGRIEPGESPRPAGRAARPTAADQDNPRSESPRDDAGSSGRSPAGSRSTGPESSAADEPRTVAELEAELAEVPLDIRWLSRIRDNTLAIRHDESQAFYRILAHIRDLSRTVLEAAARTDVQYLNLMQEPDQYRGQLIQIRGDLKRLNRFTANDNRYEVDTLYEGWIFTADSGSHPFRVLATNLSPELSPGLDLDIPVTVEGYFFKKEGYDSPGGLQLAPVILAKQIDKYRPNSSPPADLGMLPYMIAIGVVFAIAFGGILMSMTISDMRFERAMRFRQQTIPGSAVAAAADQIPVATIEDRLDQLAIEHARAEAELTGSESAPS